MAARARVSVRWRIVCAAHGVDSRHGSHVFACPSEANARAAAADQNVEGVGDAECQPWIVQGRVATEWAAPAQARDAAAAVADRAPVPSGEPEGCVQQVLAVSA